MKKLMLLLKRKIKSKHKQVIRENSMPAHISTTNEINTAKKAKSGKSNAQ